MKITTEGELEKRFVETPEKNVRFSFKFEKSEERKRDVLKKMLKRRFPVAEWLPGYNCKRDLLNEMAVGLSLGFVIAPKALGHALLANVNPIQGVYTAFFGALFYGTMGTSVWLSVGTGALPAIMFGEVLESVASDSSQYESLAPMLTFYIGITTILITIARLDRLMELIAPAVLSAFTVASAFLIFSSQLGELVGLSISSPQIGTFPVTVYEFFANITSWNIPTFVLSLVSIIFLLFSKWFFRKINIPDLGALLLVLFSTIASGQLDLEGNHNVKVVGEQTLGFPPFNVPWTLVSDSSLHVTLFTQAISLAFINFILMISISKAMALKSETEIDANQEVVALATVNTVGSFFGTFVITGSFSGSAIIANYKANTLLPNFINAIIMLLIMTLLGKVMGPLPKAVLASIIVVALPRLIQFNTVKKLLKIKLEDGILWILTFLVTLFTSIQIGIYCGVGFSILMLAWRSIQTEIVQIGQLEDTQIYRSLERFPQAKEDDTFSIFRIDSSLNYGNAQHIEKHLRKHILKCEQPKVILNFEGVTNIDSESIEMLERIHKFCLIHEKQELYFTSIKSSVRKTLNKARALNPDSKILNPDKWFLNVHDAVQSTVVVVV